MEKTLSKFIFILMAGALLLAVPAYAADEKPAKEEATKEESAKEEPPKEESTEEDKQENKEEEKSDKKAADARTYSPDYCEFTVTFPDEPLIENYCEGGDPDRCYDQVSFIHTFEMEATVSFRAICNKISKDVHEHYSAAVMEATLKEMTKKTTVQTFDTSYREEKGYKQAGLVGEGMMGRSPTIYLGQLWIGEGSAFSVEAEIVGNNNAEADKLFSEVLKSVRYVGDEKKKPVVNEAAGKDKKAAEKKQDKKEDKKD